MTYKDFIPQIENFEGQYSKDINESTYFSFPIAPILEAESKLAKADGEIHCLFLYGIWPCSQHL